MMTDHNFEVQSQAISDLANVLARNILPLFTETSKGKPELIGSCFLISSGVDFYIVSAAHVFDEVAAGRELFFYVDKNIKRMITGRLMMTKIPEGKNRKCDRLDIGVLKLEGPGLPPYPKVGKYPLSIDSFMPNALPREHKQYLLVGFPESKSRANPKTREVISKPYAFRNISAQPQDYEDLGVSSQSHIVIRFNRKRSIGANSQVREFPEPSGISGSPVYLLFDENGFNDPNQTPIVGVAIEHHKSRHAIVVTDINVVLTIINEEF